MTWNVLPATDSNVYLFKISSPPKGITLTILERQCLFSSLSAIIKRNILQIRGLHRIMYVVGLLSEMFALIPDCEQSLLFQYIPIFIHLQLTYNSSILLPVKLALIRDH